jgi:hypothetical protein
VVGYVLVLVDLRFNGFDVIPDLIGWALVLWGLLPLLRRSGWFQVAIAAAVVEVFVAAIELTQPAGSLTGLTDIVAGTALVFAVVTGVIATVGRPDVRAAGDPVRWTNLIMGVVAFVLVALVDAGQTVNLRGALPLVVFVGLGAVVWFLVFCWQQREQPELV